MHANRRVTLFVLGGLCSTTLLGCVDYRWEYDPNRAISRAREENKNLFLYFRNVFDPKCGAMEREVINTPEVAKLFQNSVNGFIEYPWFVELAGNYGITEVPSYVVIRADGKRRVRTGYMPKEQFIAFAQSALGSSEDPAARKPPPPPTP